MGRCKRCNHEMECNSDYGPVCSALVRAEASIESGKDIGNETYGEFPAIDYVSTIGSYMNELEEHENLSKILMFLNQSETELGRPLVVLAIAEFKSTFGKLPTKKEESLMVKRVGLSVKSKLTLMANRIKEKRQAEENGALKKNQQEFNDRILQIVSNDSTNETLFFDLTQKILQFEKSKLENLKNF